MKSPKVANTLPIPEALQHRISAMLKLSHDKVPYFTQYYHCVKSFQIRRFFWSVFSCIQSEKTPYWNTFHAVNKNDKDPLVCDHKVEKLDENTCARCHKVYDDKEIEEWFCCPLYKN